jgi:hypothetical protein
VQLNSVGGFLAISFATAFSYDPINDPQGPYVRNEYVALTDPFLLPDHQAPQSLGQDTATLPARSFTIVPNIGGTSPVGIEVFVTQANGDGTGSDVIDRIALTPLSNGTLATAGLSTMQLPAGVTVYSLDESYRTANGSPSGSLQNYDVAWDEYNSTTHTYQVYFQTFNPDNSALASSPVLTSLNLPTVQVGGNGQPVLPGWEFKSGLGAYVLAAATPTDMVKTSFGLTGQTYDAIHFQGYDTNGTLDNNIANFFILPDVSAHPGAVTHITQTIIPSIGAFPGQTVQALQFVQASNANSNALGVAWNETVTYTDAQGTHSYDQVEFNVERLGAGVFHQVIAIPDGDPQNIRLGEYSDPNVAGKDYFVLAYGDDSGTHIREYSVTTTDSAITVTQVESLFDPSTQAFANMTVLGDGRIELTYDDKLASDQTSQLDLKVFDLRTTGVTFNGQTNPTGHDNYIAGTQFIDNVTGETGQNNTYYYSGANLPISGITPTDTFNGHDNSGWNTAILPDARVNYTIATNGNNTVITNVGDPAHAGSLTIDNHVEALAFAPTEDPTLGNTGGVIHASGDELLILGNVSNKQFAIDGTATLEFTGNLTGDSSVAFHGAGETLKLDQVSNFSAPISGFSADFFDFAALGANATATPSAYNGTSTTLTVSDGSHTQSLTLAGDYSNTHFFVSDDGGGHALVGTDHAPMTAFENIVTNASLLQGGNGLTVSNDLLTQNATDADPNDQLTITSLGSSQTLGQMQGNFAQTTYTAPGGFVPPAVGQTFADQFTYTLRDNAGLTTTGHVGVLAESGTQIVGTTGHDIIQGASGDTLTGLGGGDVFVFNFNAGSQTISDFHQGQDLLDVSAFGFNQQQLQQIIDATTPGDHTLALPDHATITIAGVDVHQLQANKDFILSHIVGA